MLVISILQLLMLYPISNILYIYIHTYFFFIFLYKTKKKDIFKKMYNRHYFVIIKKYGGIMTPNNLNL